MGMINDSIYIKGSLTADAMVIPANSIADAAIRSDAAITRDKLNKETLAEYPLDFTAVRVWDAMHTVLPGTSSSDDLALVGGTFGTNSPRLRTYDVKAAGSVTLRARFLLTMPVEYVAAEQVVIRVRGGMNTTVANTTATVDIEAYRCDDGGGVGSDICATAAQSINSLSKADKDFTITAATLSAGDQLDVRVTVAVNDGASATAVIAEISKISLLCDVRG